MPIRLAVSLAVAVTTAIACAQDPVQRDSDSTTSLANERLFADADRETRAAVEIALKEGLAADRSTAAEPAVRLANLRTLASSAARELPAGSRAQLRVDEALARASTVAADRAAAAADELRLELADVRSDLAFRPVREAELPKGFPDFQALDEIELRDYPAYRMVRAPMRKNGETVAFWMLFQHIKKNDIAMTTPVQFDYEADGERVKERSMAFLYGDAAIGEKGLQGKVEVVDVAAATVLSLGARGYERPDVLKAMRQRLHDFARAHAAEFEVAGEIRMMGYNSPSVGDERRYFELQLPVRLRGDTPGKADAESAADAGR